MALPRGSKSVIFIFNNFEVEINNNSYFSECEKKLCV